MRALQVLDLGCGQGWFSRELALRGAVVVAIDLAENLLAYAREHERDRPLGIEYHLLSAASAHLRWPNRFNLVTGCMSLHHMSAPSAVLSSSYGALQPGGRMVFSVPHPCTDTPYREWLRDAGGQQLALMIDRYFESGPTVCCWRSKRLSCHWDTPYWRHTLSE